MTVLGELAALVLRLKFGNKVNPVVTDGGEHRNFLFRKSWFKKKDQVLSYK